MTPSERKRLSRFLSLMLRHSPSKFGLVLDSEGFVPLESVLGALHQRGHGYVTLAHLEEVMATSDKRRFEVQDGCVRAVYGHSIEQRIEYTPAKPPPVLYHGTTEQAVESILSGGLKPMSRQYVHLASDVSLAAVVGHRRQRTPVILEIDARRAHEDGILFYRVDQDIWLVESLPAEYIIAHYTASVQD
jgi:putative RNA 2'-phosphotransferase